MTKHGMKTNDASTLSKVECNIVLRAVALMAGLIAFQLASP
jgi:hypothetical protein